MDETEPARSAIGEAPEGAFAVALDWLVLALESAGATVIVLGVAWAGIAFARGLMGKTPGDDMYRKARSNVGRAILLGLELLVGADIVATITAPLTLDSVGLLGLVVLIRTFLSFSLETELEGRWPWRRNAEAER